MNRAALKSDLKYRRGDRECGRRCREIGRCGGGNSLLIDFLLNEIEVKVFNWV